MVKAESSEADESSWKRRFYKFKSFSKKSAKIVLSASLVWSSVFQMQYCVRGNINTTQRATFEQEFGFPLLGYLEDVEHKEGNISKIANAVHREKVQGLFDMNSIRISSSNFFRKSVAGQLEHLIFQGYGSYGTGKEESIIDKLDYFFSKGGGRPYMGIAPPDFDRIYLNNNFSEYTIMHELCHIKTEKVHDEHPEFKDKWLAVSGEDSYSSLTVWFFSKMRFVGDQVKMDSYTSEENERDGFVNSYSRYWWYEDVAEVCEESGSRYHSTTVRQIYDDKNEKIISKFKLAQEYGLIPKEFLQYLKVEKAFKDDDETKEAAKEILDVSDDFLTKHPGSVYEISIRNKRGKLLEEDGRYEEAVAEYKIGLQAEFKNNFDYKNTLHEISICYAELGDESKMRLYESAEKRYEQGWKDNDIKITIYGVNDFLKVNGEKF